MTIQRKLVVIHIFQEELSLEAQKELLQNQTQAVSNFIDQHPDYQIAASFYQVAKKQKTRNRWTEVLKALNYSAENFCDIIFTNIQQYHGQTELGEMILKFFSKNKALKLTCIDQKFINENNICEIVKHFLQRRKKHGELIKQGLIKSGAKSGNPKASTVIARVNKPKILCSIAYALLFDPVVSYFEKKNLPQRKIVEELNRQGYCAPEGGKWVLSQFQKVLERVRVNRLAFAVGSNIEQMIQTTSYEVITESLASQYSHLLLKNKFWTVELVKIVHNRTLMLRDLLVLNQMFKKNKNLLVTNKWERLSHSQTCELVAMTASLEDSQILSAS